MILALITAMLTFAIGVYGVLSRRDILRVVISVTIMLSSITLLLLVLAHGMNSQAVEMAYSIVPFVWAVEVMEVIVALALFIYLARNDMEDMDALRSFRW